MGLLDVQWAALRGAIGPGLPHSGRADYFNLRRAGQMPESREALQLSGRLAS